jgi:Na+-transporting methylmalonyl-CoA/oxaloacetate decarboxylase gamma subunit
LLWGGFVLCVFYLLILVVGLVGLWVLLKEDFAKCARRTKTTKNKGQNTHQESLSLSLSLSVLL